jgi:hypothetical protein
MKTEEGVMKRFCGVAVILFLLLAVRVYAQSEDCDYVLSFEDVRLSGKQVEDGYFLYGFSEYGYYLDICGFYTDGNTTESIYAELSDDSDVFWGVYGTIIWNEAWKKAYVQASYLDDTYSTYLDGTIKYSGGWYRISAKGGDNDSFSYITLFNKINGIGGFLDNEGASLSKGGRTKFKNLDKSRLLGMKKKLPTQPGQQRKRLKVSPSNRSEQ